MASSIDVKLRLQGAKRFERDAHGAGRSLDAIGDKSGRVAGQTDRMDKSTGRARRGLLFLGKGALIGGAALGGGLFLGAKKATGAFEESRKVIAQTRAVLRSTGGVANVTGKDVDRLTESLMNKSAIDDETIRQGANMLLTFTRIRNEVGKGNEIFDRATLAATNMGVALGTDARSAALQLGKALNDPANGMTRLMRSGVTFTDQQKEQVKVLQESGDMLGAQKIILREVNKEFGGSAAASRTPLKMLVTQINELFEVVGKKLAPAIDAGARFLTRLIKGFQSGKGAGKTFSTAMSFLKGVIAQVQKAFRGLGPELRAIGNALRHYGRFVLAVWRRLIPALKQVFGGLLQIIRGFIQIIGGLLRGDFRKVWEGVKNIFSGGVKAIWGILRGITAPIREAAARVGQALAKGFSDGWTAIKRSAKAVLDWIVEKVQWVLDKIRDAKNKLNSLNPVGSDGGGLFGLLPSPRNAPAAEAAGGTATRAGMAFVGEHGRELIYQPRGASVIPLSPQLASIGGGGESVIHTHVYIDGRQAAESVDRHKLAAKARR